MQFADILLPSRQTFYILFNDSEALLACLLAVSRTSFFVPTELYRELYTSPSHAHSGVSKLKYARQQRLSSYTRTKSHRKDLPGFN